MKISLQTNLISITIDTNQEWFAIDATMVKLPYMAVVNPGDFLRVTGITRSMFHVHMVQTVND